MCLLIERLGRCDRGFETLDRAFETAELLSFWGFKGKLKSRLSVWKARPRDWVITSLMLSQWATVSTKDYFSKCDQIRMKLQIWSHLQKKSLMENFILCAVTIADLKISVFVLIHIKIIPWKLRVLSPKNSRDILQ